MQINSFSYKLLDSFFSTIFFVSTSISPIPSYSPLINSYLINPELKSLGRDKIKNNFAGFFNKLSSERITERIIKLIE